MIKGWYYLHVNGDLIYKRELGDTAADIRESDLARGLWSFDPDDRAGVWDLLVEALSAGANKDRIIELATHWGCNDDDARTYAEHRGLLVDRDGNMWCASGPGFKNIQESPCGFGETKLEAMAKLCTDLDYKPSKMWGPTFRGLLERLAPENDR